MKRVGVAIALCLVLAGSVGCKKKDADKPRGPIPMKQTGRSFSLDDVDAIDEPLPEMDDVATSKPTTDEEIDGE